MLRRTGTRPEVFDSQVLIEDSAFDSDYFRVTELPSVLTAGKNMMKLQPNLDLLAPGMRIFILVTDISGNPIYHHIYDYQDSGGRELIGIWIYPEIPPGLGKIEIRGVASLRLNNRPVPNFWLNKYNVRWVRDIVIEPARPNITPIIFRNVPGVKLTENIREYLTQTYTSGGTVTSSLGSLGNLTYNNPNGIATIVSDTPGSFTADMLGGLVVIPEPNSSLQQDGAFSLAAGETYNFSRYIVNVLNDSTIEVEPYNILVESNSGSTDPAQANLSSISQLASPTTFGPISNYTMSWQQNPTYVSGSQNSQSFASITLKNLDPMVGNVHSVKTFMKSAGYGTYQLVSEDVLQERNLLINVDSGLAYDPIGDFKNQDIINMYWTGSFTVGEGIDPAHGQPLHNDTFLMSAIKLGRANTLTDSSSYLKVTHKTPIEMYQDNEYNITFNIIGSKFSTDQDSCDIVMYVSSSDGTLPDTDSRKQGVKVLQLTSEENFTATVSQFTPVDVAGQPVSLIPQAVPLRGAGMNLPSPPYSTQTTEFVANTSNTIGDTTQGVDERQLSISFTPSKDTNGHLVFVVPADKGDWYISNIKIEGATDYGFTPNHTFVEAPIQTPQADDILDFKFEFYNANGEIANITLVTQSIDFAGSNLYISGNNNQLSGSVTIGNGLVLTGFSR